MSPRVDPPARDREAAQPFTVRRATALDAAALTELRAELFAALGREQESGANARFRERSTAALNEGLSAGFCYAWLALSPEGGPVGSAALLLFPRLPTPELPGLREGYLVSVYTAPAWRRPVCQMTTATDPTARPICSHTGWQSRVARSR